MDRVKGVGGIFFKARDPRSLQAWYVQHLGLPQGEDGYVAFAWRDRDDPRREGTTIWSAFPRDTRYFEPSESSFMINYRVDDLDAVLAALRAEGVWVDDKREDSEFGRFGWLMDPEGNRVELWEPPGRGGVP